MFSILWLVQGARVSVPVWGTPGDAGLSTICLALLPENRRECSGQFGDVVSRATQTQKKRGSMGFPPPARSDGLKGMAMKQAFIWRKLCILACRQGPQCPPLAPLGSAVAVK